MTNADPGSGRLLSASFGRQRDALPDAPAGTTTDDGAECRAAMRSVLETQIIPRLLQVTRPDAANVAVPADAAPSPAELETFAAWCAAGDRPACSAMIDRLMTRGLPADSVLVELIAPAARLLGRSWDEDRLSFMAVTIGLALMHELIHELGYAFHEGPQVSGAVHRVMLASAPGSMHVLGLSIVSEFFRNAGWQVVLEVSPSRAELCRAVENEWFDLLGLSVGLESQLAGLGALVSTLRSASRNPQPPVLLGGPVFLLNDRPAAEFGAQAICRDARDSLSLAASLLQR